MPRYLFGLTLSTIVVLGGCCGPHDKNSTDIAADAPDPAAVWAEPTDGEVRVYEIRDLLGPNTSFEAPPFDPTGRDPQPALIQPPEHDETQVTRAEVIEQFVTLITETVGTIEHWEAGDGSVRELNGNLIIKTNADNHDEIEQMFALFREIPRSVMLTETRLLMIPETNLRELYDMQDFDAPPIELDEAGSRVTGLIDPLTATVLVEMTLAKREGLSITLPRIASYNGQTAHTQSLKQRAYVSDAEPSTGEGNENGVDVTVSVAESGTTMIVRGTFDQADDLLSVELEPRLSSVAPPPFPAVRTVTSFDGKGTATVEAPEVWSWRSVARFDDLPSGSTVMFVGDRLVGAAAGFPFRDAEKVPADLARRPVVLVQLKVMSMENDEPGAFPEITSQLRSLTRTEDMTVPVDRAEQ
ncbi:MAG: hypothetical protein AAF593_13850 [Planctomycetota bacterium]